MDRYEKISGVTLAHSPEEYIYDGLRTAFIDRYEVEKIGTGEICYAELDTDWNCWTVYDEDGEPWLAVENETLSDLLDTIVIERRDWLTVGYKLTTGEVLSTKIDVRMDDNFSDFELFGSKLDEVCYDPGTDLHYHRITVKTAGDGYVTTIYAIDDDGNYMEYTGEIARSISEGHEWDLVSIS